jgi:hypothetical protein
MARARIDRSLLAGLSIRNEISARRRAAYFGAMQHAPSPAAMLVL